MKKTPRIKIPKSVRDYVFNSEKFEKKFNFKPTPYQQGIDEVIVSDYR